MIGEEREEGQEGQEGREGEEGVEGGEAQKGRGGGFRLLSVPGACVKLRLDWQAQPGGSSGLGIHARIGGLIAPAVVGVSSNISSPFAPGSALMPYVISWPDNTFLVEFAGKITAVEVEAVNHAFSGDARMDNVRYQIWDLSRVTSYEMPEHEVVYAAAFDKGVTAVRSTLRGAMVASDDQVRQRVEKYLAACRDLGVGWDTRLFYDMQSAKAWLEGHA